MKTLKDLTQETRNKIPKYQEKAVKDLYSGAEAKRWKKEDTIKYVEYVYKLGNQTQKPVVVIANNPNQYKLFFNLLFNKQLNTRVTKLVNAIFVAKNKVDGLLVML